MLPNKHLGSDYKESYKKKHHSKFLSTDPEVKKKFGVFKVTDLLKPEDQLHFKKLYNYDYQVLDQYKLPLDRDEIELIEKKQRERIKKQKIKEAKEKANLEEKEKKMSSVTKEENEFESKVNTDNERQNTEEDVNPRNLKEMFVKVFNPNIKKETDKEEEELYVKRILRLLKL